MKKNRKHPISAQQKTTRVLFGAFAAGASLMMPMTAMAAEGTTTTMAEAWFNTFLGVGTVFVMLIVMSLIIYCFRIIPSIQNKLIKKNQKEEDVVEDTVPFAAEPVNMTDDVELVAVIAAAIAASEQVPLDSFRVRTIKRRY